MSAPRLALLDYGMGNMRSAEKALERVGARVERTVDLSVARGADGLVLPGDGAFPRAMQRVRALGFDRVLAERLDAGVPVLGICVGMQLLFEGSDELGGAEGLGLLPGRVVALDAPGLKVPHIGWSPVTWRPGSTLALGLPQPCPMYHVHSYAPVPERAEDVAGTADYGTRFASVVERGRLAGVQFHPEKSGADGLGLLGNFVARCRSPVEAAA
jgi:glutamine amidotransferase